MDTAKAVKGMEGKYTKDLIDALESGEYKQGHAHLHVVTESGEHRWCCLGVALDIMMKSGFGLVASKWVKIPEDRVAARAPGMPLAFKHGNDYCVDFPPAMFIANSGLSGDDVVRLANLNDDGYTFKQIADYIRNVIQGDEGYFEWKKRMRRNG